MRGMIVCVGLVVLTVAACDDRRQLAALSSAPAPPTVSAQRPPPVVATSRPPVCPQQQAAEILQGRHTLEAANDPCVVYWRSLGVRQHPASATDLECAGLKAYPDPQPPGHPASLPECDRSFKEGQQRMGFPVEGMSNEQKATYRATWGG
jgi:hypothetical protein